MRCILRCEKCNAYTMREQCACGGKAVPVIPMKYSPQDKYADYRRRALRQEREKKGLL